RFGAGLDGGRLSQAGLQPGHQLTGPERLDQEIIGAGIEAPADAGLVLSAADEEDRDYSVLLADPAADLQARAAGDDPVQQHGDRLLALVRAQTLVSVVAHQGPKALFLQDGGEKRCRLERILYDPHRAVTANLCRPAYGFQE